MKQESWKSQTWWSLPVYTGDVSGVCSALYELGGMVVMHDPSGCNSTYNTHDEIRWTSRESLIFLSGLTQLDAITGNDRRLIDDITAAAMQFHPAFIAIANSPVPWLIGTDFAAICAKVRENTKIPVFHVETNAMHDYTVGAGEAFLGLSQLLLSETDTEKNDIGGRSGVRVNLLGMTPLDFPHPGEAKALVKLLEEAGFHVVSCWAMEDTLERLKRSFEADVNLVVSSTGIRAARWMEKRFRIPYVAGVPAGAFSDLLLEALRESARDKASRVPYLEILQAGKNLPGGMKRCIAGEPVTMGSVAADRILREGEGCALVPLTETAKGLVLEDTEHPAGERQIRSTLEAYDTVIGDPMLKDACSAGCRFEALPHFALSGRMYLDQTRPLIRRRTV